MPEKGIKNKEKEDEEDIACYFWNSN